MVNGDCTFVVEELLAVAFEELGPLLLDLGVCDIWEQLVYLRCQSLLLVLGSELESILNHEVAIGVHDEVYKVKAIVVLLSLSQLMISAMRILR